jgi:type I restriction enzyme, S subunit
MREEIKYLPITHLLKEIVDNRGKSVPTVESGFPLIATNCIKHSSIYPTFEKVRYVTEHTLNTWFRSHLQPNDILFVNKGTPGRVCLVPDPVSFCVAQDMIGLRCDEEQINYKYLFAVLRSKEIQKKVENNHVGLVIPHFRKQELPSLMIPVRSKAEQECIGNIYFSLSRKIEVNNLINAELEAMIRALYDYWFVQFDFPDNKGRPYKSSGGKLEWNNTLNREIPEKWDVCRLGEIVRCNYHSFRQDDEREFINYLDTSNLSNNVVEAVQYIDNHKTRPSRAQRIVNKDDILYSTVRPNQRHFGIIKHPSENLVASTGFAQLTSKRQRIKNELIYLYLTSPSVINRLQKVADGSVSSYPSISHNDLIDLNIALPRDDGLLNAAGSIFAASFEAQSVNQQENKKLAELRDWLLPLLMNGQVRSHEYSHANIPS